MPIPRTNGRLWVSIDAKWRTSAGQWPRKRLPADVRPSPLLEDARRLINACGAFWCASKGARPISAVAAPAISRLFRHRALRKTPCYARHRREMVHVRFGSLADTSRRPADVRFTPKQTFAGVSASPLSAISGLVHPYFAIRLMALTRWPPSESWARTRRRNSLIASAKS